MRLLVERVKVATIIRPVQLACEFIMLEISVKRVVDWLYFLHNLAQTVQVPLP